MGTSRVAALISALILLVAVLGSNFVAGQTVSSDSSGTNNVTNNATQGSNQSDGTVRVDPLDHLRKYRGGYDITNKHYWSSTIYTGVSGYVIGILWLLGGIGFGAFLVWQGRRRSNGKPKQRSLCNNQSHLWPILFAIFFTVLAITASGLVLGGSAKFHSQGRKIIDIIMDTADDASDTMYNTTGAMKGMRDSLNETANSPGSTNTKTASSFLNSTSVKLDAEADDIERQARKNRRLIDKGLKIVYAITTAIISLNLAALIALSVCGTLRFRVAANWLIALCWILTAICWILFGFYFFLDEFAKDTCTALESFQQNPYNNSLSSILPCDELLHAKPVLLDVSKEIYDLVDKVNKNISASYPGLVQVCNPFSGPPDYEYLSSGDCSSNTIKIGQIPQVLKYFTCSGSGNETCSVGDGLPSLTPTEYNAVVAYTGSIQTLLDAYPGMESLLECQSVKDAFSEILSNHCKPFKKYAHMTWASMVSLSIVMMALVLIWAVQSRHHQRNHNLDGSVKPHSLDHLAGKHTHDTSSSAAL